MQAFLYIKDVFQSQSIELFPYRNLIPFFFFFFNGHKKYGRTKYRLQLPYKQWWQEL